MKYKVVIFKDYSINGKEQTKEVNSVAELAEFLETAGYDTEEKQIQELMAEGGEYKGLNASEFKIELVEEIEKTPFNDSKLFQKEYKEYLVGMPVVIDGKKEIITNIIGQKGKAKQGVQIETEKQTTIIDIKDAQSFLDGTEVEDAVNSKVGIMLLIQKEEPIPVNDSPNQPEFKYYVIDVTNDKILAGFQYKEDAEVKLQELLKFDSDRNIKVYPDRHLIGTTMDVNKAEDWLINNHDWDIIRKSLVSRAKEEEFSEREAEGYFNEFKNHGRFIHVIKASLVILLRKAQEKLRSGYILSNLERVNEQCDESCRIQKELKRVLAMEK